MLIGEGSGGTQLPMKRGSGAELCRCGIQLKGDMCLKCPPTSSILLMRTSIKTANEVMLSCSAKAACLLWALTPQLKVSDWSPNEVMLCCSAGLRVVTKDEIRSATKSFCQEK